MPSNHTGTTVSFPGLDAPVELLIDPWGVVHIYAQTSDDAFRAQGYNAARDRLWQIDTWRRRGLGLLSEVFGAELVPWDRAARLFLYRGDMHREWLAYSSDTKRVTTAFVQGVNAYVAATRADPGRLPVEFVALDYEPSLWAPEDIALIRNHGLFANLRQEVARALTLRDFGPEVEDLRRRREPGGPLVVPDGLDVDLVPDDVLGDYLLATLPAPWTAGPAAPGPDPATGEGSNNWVLDASMTATGRPLLANDPHRAVLVPSLRYAVHLAGPDFDVIGAGEPMLPGVSIGHNGQIAFGFTVFPVDQEDLYVYRTNPDAPGEYRYRDRWEPMEVVNEAIPVRGGAPVDVELAFTRHGPVIHTDPTMQTAFAVRAAWLEAGMAPYLGSIDYMRATNWDQFAAALNRWGAPGENQVYADVAGNIAWKAAGLTPIRPNWDGSLPVPGDGRYEWAGYYDMDELPGVLNPATGWIATANENNLPPDFPPERTITHDWLPPFRRRRIGEVLGAGDSFSAADLVALQEDHVSLPARQIVDRLRAVPLGEGRAADAARLLCGWDATLAVDSAPGALFEIWFRRHLRPALRRAALQRLLAPDRVDAALARILPPDDLLGDARIDLDLLEDPGDRLGPDGGAVIATLLASTLAAAWDDVADLLGADPATWSWGRIHRARLAHPLHGLLPPAAQEATTVGPLPRGGSGDTPGANNYLGDYLQTTGASFRVVVDVGAWDASLAMNSPGQSGDPASRHFADLFGPWARCEAFPLLYTRSRIEAVAEQRIRLVPGGPAGYLGRPSVS